MGKKIIIVCISGIIMIYGALNLFYVIYPEYAEFYNLSTMFKSTYYGGYGYYGYLNRLNAIPIITDKIFNDNTLKIIFGIGTGNAEYSKVSFLISDFYKKYSSQYMYIGFGDAMIFLENGLLGLIAYCTFFISIFRYRVKEGVNNIGSIKSYVKISKIIAIFCIILIVYNNSLRTESVYIMGFFLALPYPMDK